jgi:hypothetical protein
MADRWPERPRHTSARLKDIGVPGAPKRRGKRARPRRLIEALDRPGIVAQDRRQAGNWDRFTEAKRSYRGLPASPPSVSQKKGGRPKQQAPRPETLRDRERKSEDVAARREDERRRRFPK